MKKLLLSLACYCISIIAFAQSNLILPQGATASTAGHILKTATDTQGYSHTNGTIGVGTYVGPTSAYIQTHTLHPLHFAVGNGDPAMTVRYSATESLNGNIGINMQLPTEKLHVDGKIRASSLAGTGVRNVYTDANGILTSAVQTRTLIITPQSFQRRFNSGSGTFVSSGSYIDCYMVGPNATDELISSFTLPVGATITGVSVYFTDNDANNNLKISVEKSSVTTAGVSLTMATFFQNTINANPFDITTLSSGILANVVGEGEYYKIGVQPRLLDSASAGVWNYAGGGSSVNYMSIKGVKVTYTL